MAGPTILGGGGGQGVASIQQGLASIQQLGQFLEQKRQFEEDQTRLNRMQDANWGSKMLDEIVKTTGAQSIKDVARDYPSLLSMIFQKGLGTDEATVMPWITALANSPYNATEAYNEALSVLHSYGSGSEDGSAALSKSLSKTTAASGTVGVGTSAQGAAAQKAVGSSRSAASLSVPATAVQTRAAQTPLDALKGKLAAIYKTTPGGLSEADAVGSTVTQALHDASIEDAKTIQTWIDAQGSGPNKLARFKADVVEGRFSPGAAAAVPSPSVAVPGATPAVAAASPPPVAAPAPAASDFWTWMFQQGKVSNSQGSEAAQAKLIQDNPGSYQSFLNQRGTTPATTPVAATTPDQTAALGTSVDDLISSVFSDAGTGRIKQRGKSLEQALSPVIEAQLKADPEGIKRLVQNALFIVNSPDITRGIAVLQNAPSVYAQDQAASGNTAQSRIEIAKAFLGLQKAGIDLQIAQTDLIGKQTGLKLDQQKMVLGAITLGAISEGGLVPPELASQFSSLQKQRDDANAAMLKARSDGRPKEEIDGLVDQVNKADKAVNQILVSIQKVLGQQDSPQAQALAAAMDATIKFVPQKFLFFNRSTKAGRFVAGAAQAAAAKPTLTQAGADFDKTINAPETP